MENYNCIHVNDVVTDWSYVLELVVSMRFVSLANPSNFHIANVFLLSGYRLGPQTVLWLEFWNSSVVRAQLGS